MFGFLFGLIEGLLDVYKLLIIVYCVINVLNISANKWTELLRSIMEPLLVPIRKLLAQYLPRNWQILDWSPAVLFILVTIVQWLL